MILSYNQLYRGILLHQIYSCSSGMYSMMVSSQEVHFLQSTAGIMKWKNSFM